VIYLSSCKEDNCKALVCAYDGICNDDGSCTCAIGYEGERCETVTRDKFKGVWTVTEDGSNSNLLVYAASIEDGNSIDEVLIRNFNNEFNSAVTANVKGDTIYIPNQSLQVGEETKTIEGKGYAVREAFYDRHGKLILNYKVTSADGTVNNYGTENPSIWTK